jgi:hypothetical protein
MSELDPDPLIVFQCRANVQAMTINERTDDERLTRFVGVSLSATPASLALSGTRDEDWLHYLLDPDTAEKLAEQMLAMVAQIRAR